MSMILPFLIDFSYIKGEQCCITSVFASTYLGICLFMQSFFLQPRQLLYGN